MQQVKEYSILTRGTQLIQQVKEYSILTLGTSADATSHRVLHPETCYSPDAIGKTRGMYLQQVKEYSTLTRGS